MDESRRARKESTRLELSVVKANLRKEDAGVKFRIKQDPHAVLESFEEISGRQLIEEPSHFFVAFEYGIIPDELRDFIETEPSDLLRVEMRKAVENIIYETLLDAEYHAETLRDMRVPHLLAKFRAECVPWTYSKRLPAQDSAELCNLFEVLLKHIEFGTRANSSTVYDVQPFLTHSLPTEVGDRKEFDHVFKLYCAEWPHGPASTACFSTSPRLSVDNIPLIVAKIYKFTEGTNQPDKLLGVSSIPTPQLLDYGCPFRGFWKTMNTPLVYRVIKTDVGEVDEDYQSVADLVGHKSTDADFGKRQRFTSLWRVLEHFYDDGCNPLKVLGALLECLKNKGDSQNLPNGYTITLQHNSSQPFFGEIYFKSHFVIPESQRQFTSHSHIQTMAEWQTFYNMHWRVPFDLHGGPLHPSLYDPNITGRDNATPPVGKVEFEIRDYNDIRVMEAYTNLLEEHSLLKWKTFLTGQVGGLPAILGGNDQWAACETVYETSSEDILWGSNWMHAVNFHFGESLPRFLVEVWVGEEFSGEYLVPELPDIAFQNQDRCLWPLVVDASNNLDGITRRDYRKKTAPTEVKGWLWIETRWKLTQPRAGRLSFKIREARNVSTRSVREDEVMPGAPRVVVWMYDRQTKDWSEVLQFTPFQYALYFLHSGQADRIMKDLWRWDSQSLGRDEPNWFNYFSWDAPGSLCSEVREFPVTISGMVPLHRSLRFHAFETRYPSVCPMLWTLCKNGIPSLMRPYIWSELSGGQLLKHKLDSWAQSRSGVDRSAFEIICGEARSIDAPVFHLIDDDLEVLGAAYGLDSGHKEFLNQVLRALTLFTAPPSAAELQQQQQLMQNDDSTVLTQPLNKFDQTGANMGTPIIYSSRLLQVAYFLSLDFAASRVSDEELFYILLSLFSTRKSARQGLPAAPFASYVTKSMADCRSIMPTEMSGHLADALLLKTVIRWLHPEGYAAMHNAGVSMETLFAPHFQGLFAGLLPTQSLYRLWDMAFNVIWVPPEVIDVDITFDEVQTLITLQRTSRSAVGSAGVLGAMCVQASGLQNDREDLDDYRGSGVRAHKILFEGSMGRRILFAFAYSFVVQMMKALPRHPTALEVLHSMSRIGAELRDSSEVVRFVERGDFFLFTSRRRINQIYKVFRAERDAKLDQLVVHQEQNALIERIIHPRSVPEDVPTNYALRYSNDVLVKRSEKVSGVSCEDPGLSVRDFRSIIYPTLKHHSLYCHPDARKVVSNTQGRLVVNINRLRFLDEGASLIHGLQICVCFDKNWKQQVVPLRKDSQIVTPTEGGVFVFNIDHPPPYTLKLAAKDETGRMIAKLNKAIQIRKLTTQGSSCRLLSSALFDPQVIEAYLQWAVYVPTTEMFLPELGGQGLVSSDALRPGTGSWGDIASFDPLYVDIDRRQLEKQRDRAILSTEDFDLDIKLNGKHSRMGLAIETDNIDLNSNGVAMVKFSPLDRPRAFNGFNKILLEGIILFGMPNLLHSVDDIVVTFGRVRDHTNFQQMLNTNICMREFITSLILHATGPVLDKITLLFDLYAHHEPEKLSIQENSGESELLGSNSLYYHPMITPDAPTAAAYKQIAMLKRIENVACTLDSMLPEDTLPAVAADERVRMNAISMAACAAMLSQIFPRSGVHLNTLELIQHACHTFDPFGRVPRVLSACLSRSDGMGKGLGISKPMGRSGRSSVLCGCSPVNEWEQIHTEDGSCVDVSQDIIDWVARSTAETGWYGLNFFRHFTIDSLGLIDPFPEAEKQLVVLLTPTGDLSDVHVVKVDIDANGNITNGFGGNYIDLHTRPNALRIPTTGSLAIRRDDIFFLEGSRGLLSACYAFDLHTLVIDKFQFIMAFISNPLLTDPLRRGSILARDFVRQKEISITSSLNVKLSSSFYDRKLPLAFTNQQPVQVKKLTDAKTLQLVEDSSTLLNGETSPSTLAPSSPGPQHDRVELNTFEDTRAFETSPIHGAINPASSDGDEGADVLVTVKSARGLKDAAEVGELDPYCLVQYGDAERRTKVVKRGGRDVDWEDTFVFKVKRSDTLLHFRVFDSEKIDGDDEIGFVSLDFRSLLTQSRFKATLTLPLKYKQTEEGELNVALAFTGITHRMIERKVRGAESAMMGDVKRKTRGLEVTIVDGRELRETDIVTKLDPYVRVINPVQEFRTQVLRNAGLHPHWNEEFKWNADVHSEKIRLIVMDDDVFKDEIVGEGLIDLSEMSVKHVNEVHVRLSHHGEYAGELYVKVKILKGPLEELSDLDWENGTIKIAIQKCENLPTALTPTLHAYCVVDCDGQAEKTCICEGGHSGDVHWATSFHYSATPWPRKPLSFEVVAQSPKEEEIPLGGCSIDLDEAKRMWRDNGNHGVPFKLKLDGLGRATGATLHCNVDFVAPPRNIQHLCFIRVDVDSVRDVPDDQGAVGICLGGQESFTALSTRPPDSSVITYHQTYDFAYSGEQTISFEFLPSEESKSGGCCAFDLWSPLRQGKRSVRGDLWLMSLSENIIGKLRLGITFLESPPRPWPDIAILDIKEVCSTKLIPRPHKLSVRNAKNFGEAKDLVPSTRSKTMNSFDEEEGKSGSAIGVGRDFYVGRTFGVLYRGQPALWADLVVGPNEVWSCGVPIKNFEESGKCMEAPLLCNGMETGTITYGLRFQNRPASIDKCKYIKLTLVALNKLRSHLKEDAPTKAYLSLFVDQVNSVRTSLYTTTVEPVRLTDSWVLPYRGQPMFRAIMYDGEGETISTADVNLWEIMEQEQNAQRVGIQMYQNNAHKGGKLYLKTDFICPPDDVTRPKLLRVGFRDGHDIGGPLAALGRDLDPEVRVRSGSQFVTPPKTKNHLNPVWGDWTSVLKLEPNNPIITVDIWNKSKQQLIGSTNLHLWDVFRDPYAEWAGPLDIKCGKEYVGTVNLAMRLQIPQRVSVLFKTPGPDHPPLNIVRVFATDTPRDFRRKFIAACREIAEMDSPAMSEEQKLLYSCADLTGAEKAAYVEVDGKRIVLSDRATFETVFPKIASHESPLRLHIVNVLRPSARKSEHRAMDRQREAARYESSRGRIGDASESVSAVSTGEATDDGFTYYPLGESTLPAAATIRRKDCARDKMKLARLTKTPTPTSPATLRTGITVSDPDNLVYALSKRSFEFHPDSEAPLGALGWAMMPLTDIARYSNQFNLKACFHRSHQWAPVILHNFNSENFVLSRVAPFESVVGYDYPEYGRAYTIPARDVVPAFANEDLQRDSARLNLYQDPGAERATRFISMGAAAWLPPSIPRTLSAMSDEGKRYLLTHRDHSSPRRSIRSSVRSSSPRRR